MSTLFGVAGVLSLIAVPVLLIIFVIRWISKKSKKALGIATLSCLGAFAVLIVASSQVRIAEMTSEEREAYYAEQELKAEQREAERLAADAEESAATKTIEPTIKPSATAAQTAKPTVAPTNTPVPTPIPSPTIDMAQIEAERAEKERLAVTFEEIYKAYKENELRANDKYQYNRYRITAKINGMSTGGLLNLFGGATLTMEVRVGNTIVFFYAEFESEQEEALKKVNVGDTITFEGKCLSAGSWSECEIVEQAP